MSLFRRCLIQQTIIFPRSHHHNDHFSPEQDTLCQTAGRLQLRSFLRIKEFDLRVHGRTYKRLMIKLFALV
jgi:hypothetical protein